MYTFKLKLIVLFKDDIDSSGKIIITIQMY